MTGEWIKDHIVKLYSWRSIKDVPLNNLIPIVINIKYGVEADEQILWTWEDHFQGRGFVSRLPKKFRKPYVITLNPKTKMKTLWVEKPDSRIRSCLWE